MCQNIDFFYKSTYNIIRTSNRKYKPAYRIKKIGGIHVAAKVRDYGKLAKDIKDAVGEENIISAAHCATRLRLVLK